MNLVKTFNRFAGTAILLGSLAACGNSSKPKMVENHAEDFAPEDDTRASRRILDSQTVAGARADTTLYPAHFDGAGLSTLGTNKLDLVLRDSHSMEPLTVYIALSNDKFASEHRAAITNYLSDRGGLKASQIAFEDGPDPDNYHSAKAGIDSKAKLEGGDAAAAPAAAAH